MGVLARYDDDADQLKMPGGAGWRYEPTESGDSDGGSVAASDGGSFSDEGSSSEGLAVSKVDLKLCHLYSLHSLDEVQDSSTFASHGVSRARIREVLEDPCPCNCRVPGKVVYDVCKAFWSLPKASQDSCLWSLQAGCPGNKKKWSIEGQLAELRLVLSVELLIAKLS